MNLLVAHNATSVRTQFYVTVSGTNSNPATGLNYSNFTASYIRDGDTAGTTITLSAGTLGTWSSGGVANTYVPGVYEIGMPNSAFSSGRYVTLVIQYSTSSTSVIVFQMVSADPFTGVTVAGYASGQDPYTSVMQTVDSADAATNANTLEKRIRIFASALAGKVSGMATNAPIFRNITDMKARITATTDSSGNRSAVTLDGS